MATLHILKGKDNGRVIPLDRDLIVLGRNPDCTVQLTSDDSVSRYHARITRVGGAYCLDDGHFDDKTGVLVKASRRGTLLNDKRITARARLRHLDKIGIGGFLIAFSESDVIDAEEAHEERSTIEATLESSSFILLDAQPSDKLRSLIEIGGDLGRSLELDALLPKIVDHLFNVFRQADRCFVILRPEDDRQELVTRIVRTRHARELSANRFSRSIVRRCLVSGQAFLSVDARHDALAASNESILDSHIRSVMCVPLSTAAGKAFGVIQLDTLERRKKFTQDDLKFLCCVANQAAVAMENAKLHAEALARERTLRDLELARQVHLSFLPRSLPPLSGYEFACHYQSALEVGGDYYGWVPLPDGRLAVALGDVAGKGMSAALFMAKLSSDTRFCLSSEPDLRRALQKLNALLYELLNQTDRFVTLAMAVIDPSSHTLTLVNAGHLTPLVFRRGAVVLEDAMPRDVVGLPLGIADDHVYESCQLTLGPGDNVVLYTDGVTDALDVRKKHFDFAGVHAALLRGGSTSPAALVERLVKAVSAHAANQMQQDDITMVSLGRVS